MILEKSLLDSIGTEIIIQHISLYLLSIDISKLYQTSKKYFNIIKLNNNYLYHIFWSTHKEFYDNGSIKTILTKKDNIPIKYNNYYNNGQIKTIGSYKNGLKHDIWRSFYNDGNIYKKIPYVYGKKNGICYEYLRNGTILSIDRYVDDVFSPALTDEYFDI